MKIKRLLIFFLILSGTIGMGFMFLIDSKDPVYEVEITSEGVSQSIKTWYDEESRNNYLFLPSYAEHGIVAYDDDILQGENVVFVESANVSTLYINTATESMDQVYEDKSYKEPVSVIMYSEDGKLEYQGNDVKIKGHGNSSWNADKKPFKLIFDDSVSFGDMGEGTEWILQANAFDHTNLKNALVMDTAKNVGIDEVSDYRYVDVYLNGEYNGLYTLVQSVQDTISDAVGNENVYLAVANSSVESEDESDKYFSINDYTTAELKIPEKISEDSLNEMQNYFQKINAVIIGESEGKLEDYIDIDSWTEKYLIDEIFENFDSGVRSNYFYWTSEDGSNSPIYAGPIWDYDISFGTAGRAIEDPCILYASQYQRSSAIHILWYGSLYRNEDFFQSVVQKYRDEFRDVLLQMTENGIADLSKQIHQAVNANDVRWRITDSGRSSQLVSWLQSRIEFLDSIWLEEEPYCLVTIDPGGSYEYLRCYVKEGECLKDHPMFTTYFGDANSDWRNKATNEVIDFSAPIYGDITVVDLHSSAGSIVTKLYNNSDLLFVLLTFCMLGTIVLILFLLDLKRNGYKEGKSSWKKTKD